MECALDLARDAEDRWRQYKCLTWLAITSLESGEHAAARRHCGELRLVARQLGENEVPLADMVTALADLAESGSSALAGVEAALFNLRSVDDKSHLAYGLNTAAVRCLGLQRTETAKSYAQEALSVARTMERHGEAVVAEAILAALEPGTVDHSDEKAARLQSSVYDNEQFSARVRTLVDHVTAAGSVAAKPPSRHSVQGPRRKIRR